MAGGDPKIRERLPCRGRDPADPETIAGSPVRADQIHRQTTQMGKITSHRSLTFSPDRCAAGLAARPLILHQDPPRV